MKNLTTAIAIAGTVIVLMKIANSRRACLYYGPFKICND
jgi:hypothetical protein